VVRYYTYPLFWRTIVVKPLHPNHPEKAEIDIHEADDLYREIRVDNELVGEDGEKAARPKAGLGSRCNRGGRF
jgi:hypothetical protein